MDSTQSVSEKKRNPNRLFQILIGVSLGIHVVLAVHISGIYRLHTLSYIELTLQDISNPHVRNIPKPRIRIKSPKIADIKKLNVRKQHIPKMNIDPVDNSLADTLMENISKPDVSENAGLNMADWNPGTDINFATANDYYGMVRLRIESCKQYPESARSKHMEGRARIRFVINPNGQVSSVEIVSGARHDILNMAALNAIKSAAPFPKPPANLFKGSLSIEVTVMFELT